MQPDPRDAEMVERVVDAVLALFSAIHRNEDPKRIFSAVESVLREMIASRDALADARPDDAALRRAISRLP